MKKLLLSIALIISVFYPLNISANSEEIQPYMVATEGPIYGYCNNQGRIVIAYVSTVTIPGGGNRVASITTSGVYDSSTPFVVFTYTDNTGASTTPYFDLTYNQNYVFRDTGDFGACPF